MNTLARILPAAVLLIGLVAAPSSAQAQWTYQFNGLFNDGQQQVSFTVTRPGPINAPTSATPSPCSITPATIDDETFGCAQSNFSANGLGTGFDLVDFGYTAGEGGGGAWYFFEAGAFLTPGVYTTVEGPIQGPISSLSAMAEPCLDDPEANCDFAEMANYGNAGVATLIVRDASAVSVPEPSSLALALASFGALLLLRRRGRVTG